ncbi:MAG: hypothetical protein ACR2HX_09725 [Pyrinomonadaceae bacterium]
MEPSNQPAKLAERVPTPCDARAMAHESLGLQKRIQVSLRSWRQAG